MATIQETLTLRDQFSSTYRRYIQQAEQAQQATSRFREQQERTQQSANELVGSLRRVGGALAALQGLKTLANMSDSMILANARLELLNGSLENTANLNQKVFESANRSRGAFGETADMVAKLGSMAGEAFGNDANQVVAFAEQINKQLAISGVSAQAAKGAMTQLTQALASGVLRGDELNSVMEQMPFVAQAIADYLEVDKGKIRELASEGKITAEIVKNAVFAAADETNAKFEQMPMTWAQVWTKFGNYAQMGLKPLLIGLSWVANHLNILIPLVAGVGAAFAVFQIAAHWTQIVALGTRAMTLAQAAYNAVLNANPVVKVIMLVIMLISVIATIGIATAQASGIATSALGAVAGVINIVIQFFVNLWSAALTVLSAIDAAAGALGYNMATAFHNSIETIKSVFYSLLSTAMSVISQIAAALSKLPFIEFDSEGLAAKADSYAQKAKKSKENKREYKSVGDAWGDAMGKMTAFGKNWASDAFAKGAAWGDKISDKAKKKLGFGGGALGGMPSIPNGAGALGESGDIGKKLGKIGKDVSSIKKSVDLSKEDIKLMVDMATRRYVSKVNVTSQTPVITINGANTGDTEADRKSLADELRNVLMEQMAAGSDTPSIGLV